MVVNLVEYMLLLPRLSYQKSKIARVKQLKLATLAFAE
jgi:hypothetical protein